MSYISGNISNFTSRMHQLPTGIIDLTGATSFWAEGNSYSNLSSTGLKHTWDKTYATKWYSVTKTGIPYGSGYFN